LRVVDRVVQLVDLLSESESGLGVVNLAEELGIPPSSVHRLLGDLTRHRVVVQEPESKRYFLGPGVLGWSAAYQKQNNLVSIASAHLSSLRARTLESVFLTEYVAGEAICVATSESSRPLRFFMHVGQRMPYHAAASARAILAFRPVAEVLVALEREALDPFTHSTPTSLPAVLDELARVRRDGYAACNEEMEVGVAAVSVPVRNGLGEVIASLSVVAPEQRLRPDDRKAIIEVLAEEAHGISEALGYRSAATHASVGAEAVPVAAGSSLK
jgi:IclR family acetate operon transcriptional repressor